MHDQNQRIYDRVAFLLDEVDARLDEGFAEDGLQVAIQASRLLDRNPEVSSLDLKVDTHYLTAACQFELGDIAEALRHYESVRSLDPKDVEIDFWQARALFHSWRFEEAETMLLSQGANSTIRPGTLYYRALLADFRGAGGEADELFEQAVKENPNEYPRPTRLQSDEVAHMLEDVLASLPFHVRDALGNVDVTLARLPDPTLHASPDIDPLVLGLYRGSTVAPGNDHLTRDVDRIEVFQRNIERVVADADELREELRITLLHEIGHHLGWDERDLVQRGLN